jgi:hypothetical protein
LNNNVSGQLTVVRSNKDEAIWQYKIISSLGEKLTTPEYHVFVVKRFFAKDNRQLSMDNTF